MEKSKIDWCDSTWNPVTGCCNECGYCYARKIAERFGGSRNHANIFDLAEPVRGKDGKAKAYPYGFSPTFHRYRLGDYKDKPGRNIFVCSMADLFGKWVPREWIGEVMGACEDAPQHNYLFLTKNPRRYWLLQDNGGLPKRRNMWYGMTATNGEQLEKAADAAGNLWCRTKTFLSIEPLQGDITRFGYWDTRELAKLFDWFIVGAETGNRAGKVLPERAWVERIISACDEMGKPVFIKSSGGAMEKILGGPLRQEFPRELRRQE